MRQPTNYLGDGQERVVNKLNGDTVVNCKLKLSDCMMLPLNHYGEFSITICKRQDEDRNGNTHYVKQDVRG